MPEQRHPPKIQPTHKAWLAREHLSRFVNVANFFTKVLIRASTALRTTSVRHSALVEVVDGATFPSADSDPARRLPTTRRKHASQPRVLTRARPPSRSRSASVLPATTCRILSNNLRLSVSSNTSCLKFKNKFENRPAQMHGCPIYLARKFTWPISIASRTVDSYRRPSWWT